MGSLGFGEILVIVLVALVVFGPERLPEITKKAGQLVAKARQMSRSITESFDGELDEITAPIKDLKGEYDAAVGDMKGIASTVTGMSVEMPDVSLDATSEEKSVPTEAGPTGDAKPATDDARNSEDRAAATPDDEAS